MKPGIPWSVKGIGDEAREAAKVAARRSGMTLGAWLHQAILENSAEAKPARTRAARPAAGDRTEAVANRLEELAGELARLTEREQETAAGRSYVESSTENRMLPAMDELLLKLVERMDISERQTVDALTAVQARLVEMDEQAAARLAQAPAFPSRPEDVPGYQALEQALRNVVSHIETSERRTRDVLQAMQDRVADVASRASGPDTLQIQQSTAALLQVEARMADLSDRLVRTEKAVSTPSALAGRVEELTTRIEDVRKASEAFALRAEKNIAQSAQCELRDIEARIGRLLTETQAAMAASAANSGTEALQAEMESLNQRMDDLRSDAASGQDMNNLRQQVEQINVRIEHAPEAESIRELDRRVAELTWRLEQGAGSSALGLQLGELEKRILDLDERLVAAVAEGSDRAAILAVERQIRAVGDRVGQTEQQLANITRLEESISQLYDSLEQNRSWSREMADDAANRMAEKIMGSGGSAAMSGPSPELRALEEGLEAVRSSAAMADSRNQETLHEVHATLEKIVGKLAELERGPPGAPGSGSRAFSGEVSGHQGEPNAFSLPGALPDTPSFEPAMSFSPEPVAQDPASPVAGFDDMVNATPADAALRGDYIAAARRAAQAAAQGAGTLAAPARAGLTSRAKLALPFLNRLKKNRSSPPHGMDATGSARVAPGVFPGLATSTGTPAKRWRKLVLAGMVLLAAVSTYAIRGIPFMGSDAEIVTPTTLKAPVAPPALTPAAPAKSPLSPTPASGTATPAAPAGAAPAMPPAINGKPGDGAMLDGPAETSWGSARLADSMATNSISTISATDLSPVMATPKLAPAAQIARGTMPPADVGSPALRQAAAQGNPAAIFIVAGNYLEGKNTRQDYVKAGQWYQLASAQGFAPAQYRLAALYERGNGVALNAALAKSWYERAAVQGNIRAMYNLAVMASSSSASSGSDGAPDYAVAFKWYRQAASHGLKDSQFNLAMLYERGLGTTRNLNEALFWYTLAARQNDQDAAKKIVLLEKALGPAARSDVAARVDRWTRTDAIASANVVTIEDRAWTVGPAAPSGVQPAAAATHAQPVAFKAGVPTAGTIQHVQSLLTAKGFDTGTPDGHMGQRTVNAIKLFELRSGMKVTGQVSAALVQRLAATPTT